MSKAPSITRTVSFAVILSFLFLVVSPGYTEIQSGASISGRILLSEGKTPVAGAIVKAAELESKTIYESQPTAENGSYQISGLVKGNYDVAVQINNGLYIVNRVLSVAENESYALSLTLQENPPEKEGKNEQEKKPEEKKPAETKEKKKGGGGYWNHPLTAALTVVGIAVVVGFAIDEATKEEERPSPF